MALIIPPFTKPHLMKNTLLIALLPLAIVACKKESTDNYDTTNLTNKKWDLYLREIHLDDGTVLWDSVYTPQKESQSSYYVYYPNGTYCLRRWPYYQIYDTGNWHCSGNQLIHSSTIPNMTAVPATILLISPDTFRITYKLNNGKQTNIETRLVIP